MTEDVPRSERSEPAVEPAEVIRAALRDLDVDWEERTPGRIGVTMPGERKLRTECVLQIGPRALDLHAFVIRRPEENHAGVYRFLLERNLRMRQVAFGIDHVGDIHLTGSLPLALFDGSRYAEPADATEGPTERDGTGPATADPAAEDPAATERAAEDPASTERAAEDPDGTERAVRARAAELLDGLLGEVLSASDSSFNRILELGFAESIRREWSWRLARGESTRNLEAFRHLRPT